MPAERLFMRRLRELLRLRHSAGLSQYAIARSLGLVHANIRGPATTIEETTHADPSHRVAPARHRPVRHGRRPHRDGQQSRSRGAAPRRLARPADRSREATARDDRCLSRRLQAAKLRQAAVVENVDLRASRGLDRALFNALATSDWEREHQHFAITGTTGTGKSWIACALGHKACRDGFSVIYKRAPRLFADLAQARGEGRLARVMTTLERANVSIVDDWGPEPLNAEQRRDLLEIVDDRYDRGSLLITSQIPVASWHDVIGDPTLGDAILDRVLHTAHRIELKGDSLRRKGSSGMA